MLEETTDERIAATVSIADFGVRDKRDVYGPTSPAIPIVMILLNMPVIVAVLLHTIRIIITASIRCCARQCVPIRSVSIQIRNLETMHD